MTAALLEIAANSLPSALAAQQGGAGRIELCENLGEGGTTPSYGTIAAARDRLRIPIYVLIRPRGGDFLYDAAEIDVMRRDIDSCARLGCDGVVIGALTTDGDVDTECCRELVRAAGSMGVTFNRAFDAASDPAHALETIIALGCERVLTSGAQDNAIDGTNSIAAHVRQAGSRITVMPGGGVSLNNLSALVTLSGAREFHASARRLRASTMRRRNSRLSGLAPDWTQTDAQYVGDLVAILQAKRTAKR